MVKSTNMYEYGYYNFRLIPKGLGWILRVQFLRLDDHRMQFFLQEEMTDYYVIYNKVFHNFKTITHKVFLYDNPSSKLAGSWNFNKFKLKNTSTTKTNVLVPYPGAQTKFPRFPTKLQSHSFV